MYKAKLQELCQQRSWKLPMYHHEREGPDHSARYRGYVTVNEENFRTTLSFSSTKEALNEAAKEAYVGFCDPQPYLPGTSASAPTSDLHSISEGSSPSPSEFVHAPVVESSKNVAAVKDCELKVLDDMSVEYVYKSRLTTFTQRKKLCPPVYSHEQVGASKDVRFKAKVVVGGKTFESPDLYTTVKASEHAASRVALSSLSQEEGIDLLDDIVAYKALLHGFCMKRSLGLPIYATKNCGETQNSGFMSDVTLNGETFGGSKGKTKKQAEAGAAKLAYQIISHRKLDASIDESMTSTATATPCDEKNNAACALESDAGNPQQPVEENDSSAPTIGVAGYKRVVVFPRQKDVALPDWFTACPILPISNDEWVAIAVDAMQDIA